MRIMIGFFIGLWLSALMYDSGFTDVKARWAIPDAVILVMVLVGYGILLVGERRRSRVDVFPLNPGAERPMGTGVGPY